MSAPESYEVALQSLDDAETSDEVNGAITRTVEALLRKYASGQDELDDLLCLIASLNGQVYDWRRIAEARGYVEGEA